MNRPGRFFRRAAEGVCFIAKAVSRLFSFLLIKLVRFYQLAVSPFLGRNCRFTPTCSRYFIIAIEKYGPIRGTMKGIWRILRCHPFSQGGEDYP